MANIERLEQLKRVVRDTPDERFDMRTLGRRAACGTVACALGSAALDPWFLANTDIGRALRLTPVGVSYVFDFGGDLDERVAGIFDIPEDDVARLFIENTSRFVTKDMVIANIDLVIAGKPARPYETRIDG